jgi:hypothetical protein
MRTAHFSRSDAAPDWWKVRDRGSRTVPTFVSGRTLDTGGAVEIFPRSRMGPRQMFSDDRSRFQSLDGGSMTTRRAQRILRLLPALLLLLAPLP